MIRCVDWRDCRTRDITPLVHEERRAWLDQLYWDVTASWMVLEPARRSGHLPGFVAYDERGQPCGWTAFLLHRDCLQVLAFVTPDDDVATALMSAILHSAEAAVTTSILFCVRAAAPALVQSLRHEQFDVERYRYLTVDLTAGESAPADIRPWNKQADAVTRLFARAYDRGATIRAFAPNGTMAEWQEYTAALLNTPGCGRFSPAMSFVVPHARASELVAAVLVTDLGPSTVHVAQIAVDPDWRGTGIGTRLMVAAKAAAWTSGYRRMTLLVAASNASAVTVYERLGFADRSAFVVATRRQPILSTSLALDTGGDKTRL